jgi:HTH-type transcriptional regulator / antitoxin MqsA
MHLIKKTIIIFILLFYRDVMYKNSDICPICGDGLLKEKNIRETFEYKGEYLTIDNYIVYECPDCNESIVDSKTLKYTEKRIRDFHKKVDGLLTSDEIKKIRTSLGYTQEGLGKILGGGIKSFARYENGTVTQSKSMDNLLRIIKRFPYALNIITTEYKNIFPEIEPIRLSMSRESI